MNNKMPIIAISIVIGLILGVFAGYSVIGATYYGGQITELKNRIVELEGSSELTGTISIAGSTTVLPITQEAANKFMELHLKVGISVSGGGSGAGVKSAGSGEVDIGQSSRNIKDSEWLTYPDLVAFAIGKDSVAIVVNPNNPLASGLDLTLEDISKIFSGEIHNWSELGGEGHEIDVYTREEGSGTREVFLTYVMEPFDAEFAAKASVKPSNGEMRASVSGNKYGIAYISLGYVDGTVIPIKVDGVDATIQNVNSGKYPITRILWMFTKGMPNTLEKAFIEYMLSSEGQAMVENLGYIPIK